MSCAVDTAKRSMAVTAFLATGMPTSSCSSCGCFPGLELTPAAASAPGLHLWRFAESAGLAGLTSFLQRLHSSTHEPPRSGLIVVVNVVGQPFGCVFVQLVQQGLRSEPASNVTLPAILSLLHPGLWPILDFSILELRLPANSFARQFKS